MTLAVQNRRLWPAALLMAAVAALLSLGRLWLFDRSAPNEVLWAEDGLFTLCIHKADFWTCLTDPFAGYLLFLPRVLVWPVSVFPWEYWAITANIVAALLAGVVAALAYLIARRFGLHNFVSIAIALLPVITPMVGLEAINAIGSSYMLLLFLSALLIAMPPESGGLGETPMFRFLGFLLLLITSLTIPSAIVLALLLVLALVRRYWTPMTALLWLVSLGIGLAGQLLVVFNAQARRPLSLSIETLHAWAEAVPVSLLTFWPGLSLGEYQFFSNFQLAPLGITGWMFVGAMLVLGCWWIIRGSGRTITVGLLVLGGLGFGLIPSAIGDPNNRYFVVPLLLWATAVLVGLDRRIAAVPRWLVGLITILVLVVWSPAWPASAYRATPAPPWSDEVSRIEARCTSDPDFQDRPLFTPFWPPNWGDGLIEPTHPNVPCPMVYRWISP